MWDGPLITMLIRVGVACAVMAALAYTAHLRLEGLLGIETFFARLIAVGGGIGVAMVTYFGITALVGVEETTSLLRLVRRRTE